mmetsp:Transcript_21108/g.60522  ORF Transcript_21108/g.60522 Transcript_21108/m.60522 type:complete len:244 (-) Transcript_21108:465-1196(-)
MSGRNGKLVRGLAVSTWLESAVGSMSPISISLLASPWTAPTAATTSSAASVVMTEEGLSCVTSPAEALLMPPAALSSATLSSWPWKTASEEKEGGEMEASAIKPLESWPMRLDARADPNSPSLFSKADAGGPSTTAGIDAFWYIKKTLTEPRTKSKNTTPASILNRPSRALTSLPIPSILTSWASILAPWALTVPHNVLMSMPWAVRVAACARSSLSLCRANTLEADHKRRSSSGPSLRSFAS